MNERFGQETDLSQPIPTVMEMNDSSASAAQKALWAFDYMPNTYNFARETYDYPHDTYDFTSDSNLVNPDSARLDSNGLNEDENEYKCEMTQTQGPNDLMLSLLPNSGRLLSFKNSEGNVEDLGPNWPLSNSRIKQPEIHCEPATLSLFQEIQTPEVVEDVTEESLRSTQTTIDQDIHINQTKPIKKPLSKKAQRASLNLAACEGAPLPALNADEVRHKKLIESALKQSNRDCFDFFEKQIALKEAKEQDRNDKLTDQARQALEWEREKFDRETAHAKEIHELNQKEKELACKLECNQALLLAQNQTASDEFRERREIIKDCQKNHM